MTLSVIASQPIRVCYNIPKPVGASSIDGRSPSERVFQEAMNMEIMEELLHEKKKEVAIDDDSEPSDIADQAYKEWLEERYLKELNGGQHK